MQGDTYGVSITLLALERIFTPGATGERNIPEADRKWIAWLVRCLASTQGPSGGFGYCALDSNPRQSGRAPYWDNSNSQYALLGLGAARLLGADLGTDVWKKALLHWMECQEEDGDPVMLTDDPFDSREDGGSSVAPAKVRARGWTYRGGTEGTDYPIATGSMTAGGVSSVVICRQALSAVGELPTDLDVRSMASVRDGLGWLSVHFSVTGNPGGWTGPPGREEAEFQHYYLYGLEKAADLAGIRTLGSREWYREGATRLVEEQASGGWWVDGRDIADRDWTGFKRNPMVDTCFALLFLRRATLALATGTPTVSAMEALDLDGAGSLGEKPFRDLFDFVFKGYAAAAARTRIERAKDFVRMGKRAVPLLILRLDDEDATVRGAAIDALQRTTGLTQGYDAAAPVESRASAIRAWENWWAAKGITIVADAEIGRFRE